MDKIHAFGAMVVLALSPTVARAETVSVSLPEMLGTLRSDEPPLLTPFDMGVSFTSIDEVTVRILGIPQPGMAEHYDATTDRTSTFQFDPPMAAGLPGSPTTSPGGWFRSVDGNPEEMVVRFGFLKPHLEGYFAHLLDGEGELRVSSQAAFATTGFDRTRVLQHSVFEITSVELTFDGTIEQVPEPAACSLLGACALALITCNRRRRIP